MKEIIFFFFTIIFVMDINSYIVLPFTSMDDESQEFEKLTDIIDSWSKMGLYSNIYIGNPPQQMFTFLDSNNYYFKIDEKLPNKIMFDSYIPKNSDTFKIISSEKNYTISNEEYQYVSETFHLITNEGDIANIYSKRNSYMINANSYCMNKINFLYQKSIYSSDNYMKVGSIGLLLKDYDENERPAMEINFIKDLKSLSYINYAIWSVQFYEDSITKGNLILGSLPHEYDPENYFEDQFYTYKINYNDSRHWKINTDNFYITAKSVKEDDYLSPNDTIKVPLNFMKSVTLEFGLYLMSAPMELYDLLYDYYFKELFYDDKCTYKKIKQKGLRFIYCYKNSFTQKDMERFPTISFYVKNYDQIFDIDYIDVFKEKNEYIYFLILFDSNTPENMRLGQIFLSNYLFTFDYDNLEIGFYKTNLPKHKRFLAKIRRIFSFKNFMICFIVLMVLIIIIYFGRRYYYKRKKIVDFDTANAKVNHVSENDINQGYELKNEV